jgi:hypothetical protein
MLAGINVTMFAGKITGRQDMKKDISLTGLESYGTC